MGNLGGNVFSLLKEVLGKNPEEKARIQSLTQKGQDFERWAEIPEFMQLIS
jgi:hypothetical protein